MADTSSAFPFGWEVDSGALVPPKGRRQDWRLTSSGVGLNYSPSLPFPPPYARSTIQEPLPPASQKVWQDEVIPQLATTAQLAHCMKTHRELLAQPRYSVSASYQDVRYNKDLREKGASQEPSSSWLSKATAALLTLENIKLSLPTAEVPNLLGTRDLFRGEVFPRTGVPGFVCCLHLADGALLVCADQLLACRSPILVHGPGVGDPCPTETTQPSFYFLLYVLLPELSTCSCHQQLKLRAWRFPLTMGNQKSEIQANFHGWPNLPHDPTFHAGPQPFRLAAHHTDGASKLVVATTQNNVLAGRPFYICDKAVLKLNEPYLSTTAQDFRIFTQKELQGYTQKEVLNLDPYPLIREPGPMRDLQMFPKATRVPHLILNPAVPHRGLFSLAQETYQLPNDHKRTWNRFCPVQQPPTVSCRVPVVEIMCVPHMYETEYKCYGSGKPMPV